MKVDDLKEQEAVVEAVLFTMGRSVEIRQLAAALETGEKEAGEATERLKKRYEESVCGMQIVRLEDSYQMCTRTGYYENLIRVAATPKKQVLTDVVMETLAIIAYKQPVTKAEIEKIRGVKSDHAVNRLIEYNLVYEAGRLDAPGRPALFATTEDFLRRFGVSSTGELPTMDMEQKEEIRTAVEEELNLKLDGDGKLVEQEELEEEEALEEKRIQEEREARGEQKSQEKREAQEEQETQKEKEAREEQESQEEKGVREEQETLEEQETQEEKENQAGQ